MDIQVPPPIGSNGPQPASSVPQGPQLSPLSAVPPALTSIPTSPETRKRDILVTLSAIAKAAKKYKGKIKPTEGN